MAIFGDVTVPSFSVKACAKATIDHLIAEPQASLLNGILLSEDSGLSPSLVEAFRTTRMMHIIAISGAIEGTVA